MTGTDIGIGNSGDTGLLDDMRVAEHLRAGGVIPDAVRNWVADFRRRNVHFDVWSGSGEKWSQFLSKAAKAFDPAEDGSLESFLLARYRREDAYRTWTRDVALRDDWSPEERGEIGTWPEGRLSDARLVARFATGKFNEPDVRTWFDRLTARALALAQRGRFRHRAEDAEDFVQGFWVSVMRGRFSAYSVHGEPFEHYAFKSFVNYFHKKGQQRGKEQDRERTDDPDAGVNRPSAGRSPEDAAIERDVARGVRAALLRLGMGVGASGWLLWQTDVLGQTYGELASLPGSPNEGALRVRAHRARARLRQLLQKSDLPTTARVHAAAPTMPARVDVTDKDAARLVRAAGVSRPHLSDEALVLAAAGDVAADARSEVESHLEHCTECRGHVARLRDSLAQFETPAGKARLARLWSSFREASAQVLADSRSEATSATAAAAEFVHERWLRQTRARGQASSRSLSDLPPSFVLSNYHQLAHAKHLLQSEGLGVRPLSDGDDRVEDLGGELGEDGVRRLAVLEHERFVTERRLQGWQYGRVKNVRQKRSPYLVSWDKLSAKIQDLDVQAVLALPAALKKQGLEIYRRSDE